ncbi:GNAT family N-acetyltransferase [Kosakonia quasisacchari]|uniref:GNAT family N-acetyltransferase n=1 Tax=Kosakonia quasisacchari TaxID=2529380 RepID=A0A4R0HBG9_9ENTR|nr:GNAT family N-acetyltransferase [Kosakonia quasisacchari]TCC06490.1 GNAT family N-acetyltransferase [Kosakonia quasisacchari]
MQLRLARPAEAEVIWQIRNQAIRHGCKGVYEDSVIAAWTPDKMPESQRTMIANNPFYVATTLKDQPVATGFLDLANASVEAIFTLPEWEGKGLATQIIDAIKQEAAKRGLARITLASTPNACTFYQKQGFIILQESVHPSALARAELRCIEMEYNFFTDK